MGSVLNDSPRGSGILFSIRLSIALFPGPGEQMPIKQKHNIRSVAGQKGIEIAGQLPEAAQQLHELVSSTRYPSNLSDKILFLLWTFMQRSVFHVSCNPLVKLTQIPHTPRILQCSGCRNRWWQPRRV